MKNLEIKLLLPYNWYHARRIKIYDDQNNLLVKIAHCEHVSVPLNENCKTITIRIDYFKSVIPVPENGNELFLAVYMNFRDTFIHKYIDTLKRKCVTGHFMPAEEFDNFNLSFYSNAINYLPVSKFDKPSVLLGIIIASGLIITSVIQQENPYQDLVFFIGAASIISLIMLQSEKDKIKTFDYKSRIIATAFSFVLAFLFLSPSFVVSMLFFICIATYIIRVIASLTTLKRA
ncbi:hypothetical protein E0W68_01195 [Flavobacterium salilacus subsp. salilacus]|uniref:hypothetical protein n=1 Tax=Flavobacterium TaxID=237 RepID=UPI001074A54B|nr:MULTISPECIES: hypothetical protein [Flavobacterium]KAF2519873.1 hypothetical protein E0W68_01195 [Flavobacterium salilacus subsp. salilacus]MBE1614221.1 hypothetical protein [Flavobacterium sp. SaA2.13]